MSYAGCPGPSPAISMQLIFKMSDAAGNRPKFNKNPYSGNSKSLKVIKVTNKKLVTIACYDKQHVCAYLQQFSRYTRANSGKITTFIKVPLFDALVLEELPHPGARNFVTKN